MAITWCVALSPAAGISGLARVIRPDSREDRVCVVVQRHASGEDLKVLAECLEEIVGHPVTRFHSEPVAAHAGTWILLGDDADARFDSHRLVPKGASGLDLDTFLTSLAVLGNKVEVAVLPGLELPGIGLKGLAALQEHGAHLMAAAEDSDPESWSAHLEQAGLTLHRAPLASLFAADRPQAKAGSPRRLLIADDDAKTRQLMGELSRLAGYVPDFAVDGLDALRLIHAGSHVGLILDMQMPEMDGLETLRRLRQEKPNLPVLIATGEADTEVLEKTLASGVLGILPKPFTAEQFQRALAVFETKEAG